MSGASRPTRESAAVAIVSLALLLIAPSSQLPVRAAQQPIRIDLAATPVDADPSREPNDKESEHVKLPAAPVVDEGSSGPNVRTRTDRQGKDTIPQAPTPSPTEDNSVPRLDDPVLRWLPEIMAASAQWGVPAELIAAVMRVESQGVPGVISPAGARGLMQMMPEQIGGQGVPESLWHDPATNIAAGAQGLYTRMQWQGSWEGAVGAYLGFGCDVWGTCTDVYIRVVFRWADYYRPIIANPRESGFRVLPKNWAYGPIVLYQLPAPPKLEEPPDTPTPTATGTITATPKPGDPTATPNPAEPTRAPTEPGQPGPTAVPTTIAPTEVAPTVMPPTEIAPTPVPPTEIPTAIPTEPPPPTEVPTEPPPPDTSPEA